MELISEYFVKPKHEIEASKKPIYLNPIDIIMLRMHPIQRGLLYNYTTSSNLIDVIETLKDSLSIALVHFYPLAGQFVTETFLDEDACSVFIDCNKGPGVRLTHVAAPGVTKSDITGSGHVSVVVRKFFDLGEVYLNYDCHTRPLLSVQVTELVDGVFIGFTFNHSVVDGTSSTHFLSMLSEIFCSDNKSEKLLEISRVPVYGQKPCSKVPFLGLEEFMPAREIDPLLDRVFHFSAKSMGKIKAEVNKEESTTPNVSSFQGLCSLIWKTITRARNLSAEDETACCMVINTRPRLDPPISDNYFGNYISQVKEVIKVDELLGHDLGWAATRLKNGIKAHDGKTIHSILGWTGHILSTMGFPSLENETQGPNRVVTGGSTRFDIYGLEFGLGKAVAVRMGFGNKFDGKVIAHPGPEGGGSVDLEVSLTEEHMASLEMDLEFMSFTS